VTRIEEHDLAVTYTGTWWLVMRPDVSGGTCLKGQDPGSRVTFSFNGTGVSFIGFRAEVTGILRIYLDGVYAGDFDTYLQNFVAVVVGYFADPATRAAVPGLLVEYYREPERYTSLVVRAEDPIRELFRSAHADAVTAGTVAAEPTADSLFDTIIGIALYHGVWRHTADDRLTDEILQVVRSASRPTAARRRRTSTPPG